MQLSGITTVVFDFDGTLATCPLDFQQMRRVLLQTARTHGLDPAQLGACGLLETIEKGVELLAEDQLRAHAFREQAIQHLCNLEYEAAGCTELIPGIIPALQALRDGGFTLGIVTRNSAAAVARIIGDAQLPFDALLCREDVRQPKPHPAHVLEMLHQLESHPELSLMVGDHPMDIEMGHAAHMGTVAVLTGQSSEEELRAVHPHVLLPSAVALAALLLGRDVDA